MRVLTSSLKPSSALESRYIVSFNCFNSFALLSKLLVPNRVCSFAPTIFPAILIWRLQTRSISFRLTFARVSVLFSWQLNSSLTRFFPLRRVRIVFKSRMADNLRFCKRASSICWFFTSIISRYLSKTASTSSPRSLHCAWICRDVSRAIVFSTFNF